MSNYITIGFLISNLHDVWYLKIQKELVFRK